MTTNETETESETPARDWALQNGYTFKWTPHREPWTSLLDGHYDVGDLKEISAIDMLDVLDSDGKIVQSLDECSFGLDEDLTKLQRRDLEDQLAADQKRGT